MQLVSCPSCQALVDAGAGACPACARPPAAGVSRSIAAAVLALGLAACPPMEQPQPDYGVPLTDDDGDGYFAEEDDCDDANPDVNPGAVEVPGNGVDDDCDGQTDEPAEA